MSPITRRSSLLAAIGALLLAAASWTVHGADFPARPVRMIVAIGPGSSMDIVARLLGQKLTEMWGQTVVVDNRGGGGGNLAADMVAKAPADGYTILFCSSSLAISPSVYRKLPYNALRDLEPVTQLSSRNNVLVVSPGYPANSVKELIAIAKAKPGQLSFGSGGGTGSSDHLAGELFNLLAGVKIVHVPYKSGPQAQTDLLGGRIQVYLGGIPVNLPLIKAGKLKALGTSGTKRSPALPDVPTIAEAGVPGFEVTVWYGLAAPRGAPRAIVEKIGADAAHVMRSPELHERWTAQGVEPVGSTPSEFKTLLAAETAKWAKVVKAAGISLE